MSIQYGSYGFICEDGVKKWNQALPFSFHSHMKVHIILYRKPAMAGLFSMCILTAVSLDSRYLPLIFPDNSAPATA